MSSPAEVIAMKVFGSIADMKAARASLGHPGSLAEAITATGIDALFVLLDGGTVEVDGRKVALYRPGDCAVVECFPSGLTGQRVDFDGQYLQVWDTHGGTFGTMPTSGRYRLVPVEGEN